MKLIDANPIYSATPAEAGLDAAIARAAGSPFYRGRLAAAGIAAGATLEWERWRQLPPTTKEEMRELPDFYRSFCTPELAQTREYFRSGGVTGRPRYRDRSPPHPSIRTAKGDECRPVANAPDLRPHRPLAANRAAFGGAQSRAVDVELRSPPKPLRPTAGGGPSAADCG